MSETTNLNSELLSADSRGRKNVPVAVFAVIIIHIVLFLFLLIAAGCRAKARAKSNVPPSNELAAQTPALAVPQPTVLAAVATPVPTPSTVQTPVTVTEPPAEQKPVAASKIVKSAQKATPLNQKQRPSAANSSARAKLYVVKAGDTVEKIAKQHRTSVESIKAENNLKDHFLKPGQQLRVSSQNPKASNEV